MRLTVNGQIFDLECAESESLLETLRTHFELRGTKLACDRGECGACTVLLNNQPIYSCLALTHACDNAAIETIEGLSSHSHVGVSLDDLQAAFVEHDAVQCGYCTPGQLLSATALLRRVPNPSDQDIAEAMSGNLCRCGTYPKIARAIRAVASARNGGA